LDKVNLNELTPIDALNVLCKIKSKISINNKNLFPESMFATQVEMFL
jgi:hypothetical protein